MREAGCATQIRTRAPGYLLHLQDGDDLDSFRFTRLIEVARVLERAGRIAAAAGTLRSALALWRGPALADVTGEVIGRAVASLAERRMSAEVDLVRLELRLGRHAEILTDLRALSERYPLHEELHGYLMEALARSGREREAVEVFRRARTVLTEEVGIEPGARLRAAMGEIVVPATEGTPG